MTVYSYLFLRPRAPCLGHRRAARPEELDPIHVTFLKRAGWSGGLVSFDRIHQETGLPSHVISRAAANLERWGFGR